MVTRAERRNTVLAVLFFALESSYILSRTMISSFSLNHELVAKFAFNKKHEKKLRSVERRKESLGALYFFLCWVEIFPR